MKNEPTTVFLFAKAYFLFFLYFKFFFCFVFRSTLGQETTEKQPFLAEMTSHFLVVSSGETCFSRPRNDLEMTLNLPAKTSIRFGMVLNGLLIILFHFLGSFSEKRYMLIPFPVT